MVSMAASDDLSSINDLFECLALDMTFIGMGTEIIDHRYVIYLYYSSHSFYG